MKKRLNKKDSSEDIPRTTVLVLVFLAVIISILGTWTVLTTIDDVLSNPQTAQVTYQAQNSESIGSLGLTVEERSDESNG